MNNEENYMMELLRGVVDPELMVNIVDLGLVYDIKYNEANRKIHVLLTLTSPGCPMGSIIIEDAQHTLESCYPGNEVEIELVWEPAWSFEMLSMQAKEELGYL